MKKSLIHAMLQELPFTAQELASLIKTAPYRYKVYKIAKRKANEFRTIAQPSLEIKILQRWLIKSVFSKLPIHRAATAYRDGVSIAKHASMHAGKRYLLKMDFKDFFPSILASDVERHLQEFGKLTHEEARLVAHTVSWRNRATNKLCLSIGAPSSPILSNALLLEFDRQIASIVRQKSILYSRYADDIAFSTNRQDALKDMVQEVKRVCDHLRYPRLTVNEEKTVFTSRRWKRVLVGLVLTPDGEISLGREKKRRIRSELYRFTQGKLDLESTAKLQGELAFAWSVEPSFVQSLVRKQGLAAFEALDLPFKDQ